MPTITKGDAVEPKDICPYCSTFSCVAQTNLALKCGTAQAVLLEARAVSAESALAAEREAHAETKARLAAAEECLREIANCACDCNPVTAGVMRYHYDECRCLPKNIRAKARAFLAGGEK